MAKAFGIITAASNRYDIEGLQEYRPVSAFSFAGRYRLVDFPISNMSNSGIDRIQVYISGNPRSLVEHLGTGRNYNINSKRGKLQLLFHDEGNINRLYNTDIAAFMDSFNIIERTREDYVIITSSNMIYRQDFSELLDQHIKSEADVSLLYHRVDNAREALETLLRRIDGLILNDGEARQLTGVGSTLDAARKILEMGPRFVVVKRGEYGALWMSESELYLVPSYPTSKVVDPTGAGDSFAGAMMGVLAEAQDLTPASIKKALLYATVVASLNIEGFSLERFRNVRREEIEERVAKFRESLVY